MSPRSQEQIEVIRTESTKKILDAAYRLMSVNGYESTSIAQIAREAGISKGLMYNYFSSKEELVKQLIMNTIGEGNELMSGIIPEKPAESLANIFRWFFKELRSNLEQWRFISELMFKVDRFPDVKEMIEQQMVEYVNFIASLLAEIGFENAKEEAQLIAGLFDGIGFQYLVVGDKYPVDDMEKFLIEKYCKD